MAILTDPARAAVWAGFMRVPAGDIAATKPQLRACVDAADQWAGDNLAAFAAAIPAQLRGTSPSQVLLANAAAIAAGAPVADVAAGIAERSQSAHLLAGYQAAAAWLTSNAGSYLTALGAPGQVLTQPQAFRVLEHVCRARAAAGVG